MTHDEPPAITAWLRDPAFATEWATLDDAERNRRRLMVDDWMAGLPAPIHFGKVRIMWEAS